jgi:hypothetical protein
MNPQTTQLNAAIDHNLDRILTALRDVQPSLGLEQRIAARIAIATEPRTAKTSPFAVILNAVKNPRILPLPPRRYIFAATTFAALIALYLIASTAPPKSTLVAKSNPASKAVQNSNQPQETAKPADLAKTSTIANTQVPQGFYPGESQVSQGFSPGENQVPQGFSLGSHRLPERSGVLTPDPDTLALAETLAPSRPAPIMALTAQERMLVTATRQGQPIELAELEILRQPSLQAAAQTRERATIRNYVHSLLGPLAAVEAMNPTPPSTEDAAPASTPPSSR